MDWIHANWPYLSMILLGISEILGATPSIQANGILDAVIKFAINYLKPAAQVEEKK